MNEMSNTDKLEQHFKNVHCNHFSIEHLSPSRLWAQKRITIMTASTAVTLQEKKSKNFSTFVYLKLIPGRIT